MKKEFIKLTGENKREIRKQIKELEEKGMYFGKCYTNETNAEGNLEMTFRVENQFMNNEEYQNIIINHDPRIRVGARVRVIKTGEEFTLGRLYEFSRSHKVVFCTSDGRNWKPSTVYARCEYVENQK